MTHDRPERNDQRYLQELGTRIRDLRDHALLTQEAVAESTGISRRRLQRIERGDSDTRITDLVRIAAALKVSVHDLIQE
ncbi:helix-turn-helix domain-containing protein [Streptomyces sp. NPDC002526]